jgi:hypothetical protein
MVPSRRCHPSLGDPPPAAAVCAGAAAPTAAAAVAAVAISATVRGPVTWPAIVSLRGASDALVGTGNITMAAASPATGSCVPATDAAVSSSKGGAGWLGFGWRDAISRRRASISPNVRTPAPRARFGAPGAAANPVAQGTPVRRSTAGPNSRSTADGSTRASLPIGTTSPGHARMILAPGTISRTMPTAVAPMPSSMTTTSGWCRASSLARSAEADASPTTSYPSPSRTNRRSPLRDEAPSATTTCTRRRLMRSLSPVQPAALAEAYPT